MPFDQIVNIRVKPGQNAAFETAFAALAAEVGASEPDTLDYRLFRAGGEEGDYRVIESYTSEEALVQHRRNPRTKDRMAALGPFLAGAPTVDVLTFCCSAR